MLKNFLLSVPLLLHAVNAAPGAHSHNRHVHHHAHHNFSRESNIGPRGDGPPGFIPPKAPFVSDLPDDFDESDDWTIDDGKDSDDGLGEARSNVLDSRQAGRKNVLYFTNWGIYGANYQPQQIPANDITHVLYSFLDIGQDGTVKTADSYADIEKRYPTDSWNDAGKNVYGCVKQLYLLKKKHRNMKTLLSIGGWTYSPKFVPAAATDANRKRFAASSVKLLADWGFDGIDIDWEYPTNAVEARNYVLLLKEVRAALDRYTTANRLNYRFIITIATAAGPQHYNKMDLKNMRPYVDMWHLMAYDYAGSWDSTTGHTANVYLSSSNPRETKFSTEKAVNDYIGAGIPARQILLGMPLYGRSFANTPRTVGSTYQGVGGGTIEKGIYLFKDLPRPGSNTWTSKNLIAAVSYDHKKKELISFEGTATAKLKAQYLIKKGLGGAFYWEASGDKTGAHSLVKIVGNSLGGLEQSRNLLTYPKSVYDNIRKNMV